MKNILADNLICFEAHLTKNHQEINRQNKENIEEIKNYFKDYLSVSVEDEQENKGKKYPSRNLRK